MERITVDGEKIEAQELSPRPDEWCRHLASLDGTREFLGYLVSVGPYKFDIEGFTELTIEQIAASKSGVLDLAALARQMAEADQNSGKYERRD